MVLAPLYTRERERDRERERERETKSSVSKWIQQILAELLRCHDVPVVSTRVNYPIAIKFMTLFRFVRQ